MRGTAQVEWLERKVEMVWTWEEQRQLTKDVDDGATKQEENRKTSEVHGFSDGRNTEDWCD